jgi:hypothetical protein
MMLTKAVAAAFIVTGALSLSACGDSPASGDTAAKATASRPDLSGFWQLSRKQTPDPSLMALIAPDTAVLNDVGAPEFEPGNYGGLKLKPATLEAAQKWKPIDEMTVSNACKPPSMIYAMQGPFPIEIYQGTEFIIFKLEYYDLMRVIFMDGRPHPPEDAPHTKMGHSIGRWEGDTLVVDTTHLQASTITNNGLMHSDKAHVIERFKLSEDGKALLSTQEFDDSEALENRGARFIGWRKEEGQMVYPYDCDPAFALEYGNPDSVKKQ